MRTISASLPAPLYVARLRVVGQAPAPALHGLANPTLHGLLDSLLQ